MSIEKLKAALPEYAKDIKLNLSSITRSSVLDQEQLWGTLLASAAATRNPQVSDRPSVGCSPPRSPRSRGHHGHE